MGRERGTYAQLYYRLRRDVGLCVRCGKPAQVDKSGAVMARCFEHGRDHAATMKRRYDAMKAKETK